MVSFYLPYTHSKHVHSGHSFILTPAVASILHLEGQHSLLFLALASASPTAFSDALSPTDLVAWLSQQFQAKGLTLDPTLGKNLIGKYC